MLEWLSANIGTIAVCAVLVAVITAIIIYLINNKKKGKNSCNCGGGCSGCAMKDACHPQQDNITDNK